MITVFNELMNLIKHVIKEKKIQLEKARNDEQGHQILNELYNMFYNSHYHLLNIGMTEDIRFIGLKENMVTIAIPKSNYFKDYTPGESRKICARLNQISNKYLQFEYNRLGKIDYQFCYPTLSKGIRFMTASDHSIEFIVTIKVNL